MYFIEHIQINHSPCPREDVNLIEDADKEIASYSRV